MMEDLLSWVDKAVEASDGDYEAAARQNGILPIDCTSSILGYATHYGKLPVIGVNANLIGQERQFAGWHEMGHVKDGHIWEAQASNGLWDAAFFSDEVDSQTISRHERTANLVAAHAVINTERTLEEIGYNSPTLRQYRELQRTIGKAKNEYEQLMFSAGKTGRAKDIIRKRVQQLRLMLEDKEELEYQLRDMDICKTLSQVAANLGTTERVLRYKLEALRILGYDVDAQELERYDRMFEKVNPNH